MPNKNHLTAIENLAKEEPASLMARLRAIWPQIERAIQAGHSLRTITERLNESGMEISYGLLRLYRGRIERKKGNAVTAESAPARISGARQPAASFDCSKRTFDPLANLHEQEAKQVKWEYPSGPPDESKLV